MGLTAQVLSGNSVSGVSTYLNRYDPTPSWVGAAYTSKKEWGTLGHASRGFPGNPRNLETFPIPKPTRDPQVSRTRLDISSVIILGQEHQVDLRLFQGNCRISISIRGKSGDRMTVQTGWSTGRIPGRACDLDPFDFPGDIQAGYGMFEEAQKETPNAPRRG